MTNTFLWWVEPASEVFENAANYFEKMAEVHENTILAPAFAMGAATNATTAENLTAIAEIVNQPTIPEYSVALDGVVCRPAAWHKT